MKTAVACFIKSRTVHILSRNPFNEKRVKESWNVTQQLSNISHGLFLMCIQKVGLESVNMYLSIWEHCEYSDECQVLLYRIKTSSSAEEQLVKLYVWKLGTEPFAQPSFSLKISAYPYELRIWPLQFSTGIEVRDKNRHHAIWLILELVFSRQLK